MILEALTYIAAFFLILFVSFLVIRVWSKAVFQSFYEVKMWFLKEAKLIPKDNKEEKL